jgi:hypothetical protein
MDKKTSRRALIKGSLLAGLASATTSCSISHSTKGGCAYPSLDPPAAFSLICSGMMAFYSCYSARNLRILVPIATMGSGVEHLVRFGDIGGETLKPGEYELALPGFMRPNDVYRACSTTELSFPIDNTKIDSGNNKTYFKTSYNNCDYGTYSCWITLPWPNRVVPVRPILRTWDHDGTLPMYGDDAKNVFGVDPDQLPGAYVLQYMYAGNVTLVGKADSRVYGGDPGGLILHLYSEPPYGACPTTHIELFNGMVRRGDDLGLNLSRGSGVATTLYPDLPANPGGGLAKYDLATLEELGVSGGTPSQVCPLATQPADCVAGWVYGS